jgi:hypothetical protein
MGSDFDSYTPASTGMASTGVWVSLSVGNAVTTRGTISLDRAASPVTTSTSPGFANVWGEGCDRELQRLLLAGNIAFAGYGRIPTGLAGCCWDVYGPNNRNHRLLI